MAQQARNSQISAWTSAGAFIVATKPTMFVGISYFGSAAATTIVIKDGITTAGATIATIPVGITAGGFLTTDFPIACRTGIVATNVGTVAGYAILFTT
jgi:hypothetical protein